MGYDIDTLIDKAEKGIGEYLETALKQDRIDKQGYEIARANTVSNLKAWLLDPNIDGISPNLKSGISEAIEKGKWQDLVDAFRKNLSFGTGGIRGLMAGHKEDIVELKDTGIDASILKGPNTFNNIVLLLTSAGVARFGRDKGYDRVVIGYDSRIRGFDFAKIIAELFLAYDFTVYLFDAPCPYPEVTFAIPYKDIKAHMGILISASHNDYRYNGFKLSCGNGSQFDPKERTEMYEEYIVKAATGDIKTLGIKEAPKEKVVFLGGGRKLDDFDYMGHDGSIIDVHRAHQDHIKTFLLEKPETKKVLEIAYCPFHGAGRIAVPRLLEDVGFSNVKITTRNGLFDLDGLFPSFSSEPGKEQQPDPGDPRAARIAVNAFKDEYPAEWKNTDILIGTDPDADRCGVVAKVPEKQRSVYRGSDYTLLPADEMFALVLWHRLEYDKTLDHEKAFLTLSHTTSDSMVKLCQKHGVGVVRTWVGFASLAAGVRAAWDNELPAGLSEGRRDPADPVCHPFLHETMDMEGGKRLHNLASVEQSNGFSILGAPPKDQFSLGERGHVRDKDGTFAAVLVAEVADWAKRNRSSIFELVDKKLSLDPDIGLFVNHYEPDPLDGEYPGIEGDRMKLSILKRALEIMWKASSPKGLEIGGYAVKSTVIYRTGKYDHVYPPSKDFQFPDEGIRFYFDDERLSHVIIRPSGTTNSLRFHVQLQSRVDEDSLIAKKQELREKAVAVATHVRELVGAPRVGEWA
jgi:phosphoglucomutase